MSPERDDFREEDEQEEFAPRSIFSAGWFRAVLVLTVLAIVVVISLPYLLNWFEPTHPARVAKPSRTTQAGAGRDTAACRCARSGARPRCPGRRAAGVKAAPPAASAPAPTAVVETALPPVSSEPARKATPEKAPATPAAEKAVTKAPAKTATERPPKKTPETALAKTADKPAAPTRAVAKADAPSGPAQARAARRGALPGTTGSSWAPSRSRRTPSARPDAPRRGLSGPGDTDPARGRVATPKVRQQHELFVTEASVEKVNAALKGRGRGQLAGGAVWR